MRSCVTRAIEHPRGAENPGQHAGQRGNCRISHSTPFFDSHRSRTEDVFCQASSSSYDLPWGRSLMDDKLRRCYEWAGIIGPCLRRSLRKIADLQGPRSAPASRFSGLPTQGRQYGTAATLVSARVLWNLELTIPDNGESRGTSFESILRLSFVS